MSHAAITLAAQAIHDPHDPRHFMRLKPVRGRVCVRFDGELLAESQDALRLIEVGTDIYDPTFYLPRADVQAPLGPTTLTTHCPLKGDASYFDLLAEDGRIRRAKIAWCYADPFDFAAELAGRVAFYADAVAIEESPR